MILGVRNFATHDESDALAVALCHALFMPKIKTKPDYAIVNLLFNGTLFRYLDNMIGFLQGNVLFSDGSELVVQTNTGVGYQVYHHKIIPEGASLNLYISHVIRENSQELYGFHL